MRPKNAVRIMHGRNKDQIAQMRRIANDGVDPFDWKLLPRYHTPPVLLRGKFWLVTDNEYPYEGTSVHLLLIYKKRVRFPSETDPAAWIELREFMVWIEKEYRLSSGSLLMRFGDPSSNGGSIDHLHLHVIAGGKKYRGAKKVKASVCYEVKKTRRT